MNIHTLSRELKDKFLNQQKVTCDFRAGDILEVNRKLDDRRHTFQAICIAKKNNGVSSTFTLLKHDLGKLERFEMTLHTYNPNLEIRLISRMRKFRKSKCYYLRDKFGKQARVPQDVR
jgi:large subunit ribosomal protein L19